MKIKKQITAVLTFSTLLSCLPHNIMAENYAQTEVLTIDEYNSDLSDKSCIYLQKADNVVVDGEGSEWGDYPEIKPVNTTAAKPTAEVSGKVAWDDEKFYVYVEVKDDVFVSQGGGNYWQTDSLQIAMGLPEESFGDEIGLSFDPEANTNYMAVTGGAEGITNAVKRKGQITSYELAIPWTAVFDKKPDLFKFNFIVNDSDGSGRSVVYLRYGIHDSKYNTYFPYMIPDDGSIEGMAWIDGESEINVGTKTVYSVNILNLKKERKQKISVSDIGFDAEVDLKGESWTRINVEYDTKDKFGKLVLNPDTGGVFREFSKDVTVHPTYEVYEERINEIKSRLAVIDNLISECGKMGLATDYEEVNANTVREFLDYIMEDFENKDTDRMEYTLTEMEKLLDQAYTSLENYILGIEVPFDVPRYVQSGPLEIKDGVFYGLTETSAGKVEERPVMLMGYGHGNYNRKHMTKYPGLGGNYLQLESWPSQYVKPACAIPDWYHDESVVVEEDGEGNHYAYIKGSIKQCLPVIPETKYRLTFEAWGEAKTTWVSFNDGVTKHIFSPSEEKKIVQYDMISPNNGVFVLRFRSDGDVYIDNLKIVRLDEADNEIIDGELIIKNCDFEKTEHDSRFICEFSPMLAIFRDAYIAGQNDMLASFLLSPHYFPNWIYEKYPETYKKSIMSWDYNTEVMQDFFYEIGHEMARVLKNLGGVNDICVHNEERHPLYMDNAYLPYVQGWLADHYDGDINKLNYNYGTNYSSFEEVPMPNGYERNSQTWDLMMCTDEYMQKARESVIEGIRSVWPEVIIHGKLMSTNVLNTSINRSLHGQEPVTQGRAFGVHGLDGGIAYNNGAFIDNAFYEGNPLATLMTYDYVTSDIQAPILNTEDHLDGDGDTTVNNAIGDHSARYVWEGAVHGRTASAIWAFARTNNQSERHIRGHVNYRPDQMAKIGRAMLDVNRLSKELEALIKTERTVQILYSVPSRNRDYLSLSTTAKVYNACVYSGQKPYILTDNLYDNLNHADILIVPAARYATERLVKDLLEYVNSGKTLILLGDFCLEQNEYAKMHDKELLKQVYDKSIIIPVEYEMDTSYTHVGVNSEGKVGDKSQILYDEYDLRELFMPVFKENNLMDVEIVDTETGERVKGVKFITAEYNGNMLVDVSYFLEYGVSKTYKVLYKGKEIPQMRELRSGRLITDSTVTLDASMPQLLQFKIVS